MVKVVSGYDLLNTAKPFVFLALVGERTSHEPSENIGHNLQVCADPLIQVSVAFHFPSCKRQTTRERVVVF